MHFVTHVRVSNFNVLQVVNFCSEATTKTLTDNHKPELAELFDLDLALWCLPGDL
jgi:hypothetical protein